MSINNVPAMVSVVIPTLNRPYYLKEAVESVLNQTYKDYEIIINDDGSIDNTEYLAKSFVRRFPEKIRYIKGINAGQAVARNRGIAIMRGKYYCPLDHDDLLTKDSLAVRTQFMEESGREDVGIVFSDYQEFRTKANRFTKFMEKEHHERMSLFITNNSLVSLKHWLRTYWPLKSEIIMFETEYKQRLNGTIRELAKNHFDRVKVLKCLKENMFLTSSSAMFIRKSALDFVGGYDEKFQVVDDDYLFTKIALDFKVDYIDKKLALKRHCYGRSPRLGMEEMVTQIKAMINI